VGIMALEHVLADARTGAQVQEVAALAVTTSRFSHVWEKLMQ